MEDIKPKAMQKRLDAMGQAAMTSRAKAKPKTKSKAKAKK
jgi:hypothetical protein